MKEIKYPIIIVRANDWCCCTEQIVLRDAEFKPMQGIISGSLVHEDDISITVALQVFEDGRSARDMVTLQKTCILEMVTLLEPSGLQ